MSLAISLTCGLQVLHGQTMRHASIDLPHTTYDLDSLQRKSSGMLLQSRVLTLQGNDGSQPLMDLYNIQDIANLEYQSPKKQNNKSIHRMFSCLNHIPWIVDHFYPVCLYMTHT